MRTDVLLSIGMKKDHRIVFRNFIEMRFDLRPVDFFEWCDVDVSRVPNRSSL